MEKVKVGPLEYCIVEIADFRDGEGTKLSGEITYGDCMIRLEEDMPESLRRVTLWHEVLHAILTQAGCKAAEKVVEVLSYGIADVLQDNDWLKSDQKKGG